MSIRCLKRVSAWVGHLALLTAVATGVAWAHPSGNGHNHTTSMSGDGGGGSSSFSGGGSGGGAPPRFGGGTGYTTPAPPPPPPPPPPVFSPKVIKGTGTGSVSRVKEVGAPGQVGGIRSIGGIYEDGEARPTEEEVGRRGPRTPASVPAEVNVNPANF